jgi:hypothetical protein
MSTRQIHVFISHSWSNSDHYATLAKWIFEEKWSVGQASLDFRDYSVPKSDPILGATDGVKIQAGLDQQISRSHVLVIPSGMYASHSDWIQKEIESAARYGKPILAVDPWGQQRASAVVKAAAAKSVGWNKEPLISAIWTLYKTDNE